ncbi:MAG: hypothetical protein IJY37_09135, partial [Clostridia bacterium]|nr:hypothetical protein [Clostridia bacterium]
SQNPPFSLRFGHGSALTAVQAVIHYLAVALLPSRGRLIFSFKKKKVAYFSKKFSKTHSFFDNFTI